MPDREFLQPFVLPVEPVHAERDGPVDLYPPDAGEPRPAVVFVHEGPLKPALTPRAVRRC